jgi:hypothetical protein
MQNAAMGAGSATPNLMDTRPFREVCCVDREWIHGTGRRY